MKHLVALLALLSAPCFGAVAFDAVGPSSTGNCSTGTSITWSHTVTTSNPILFVGLNTNDDGSTWTVTAGGASMTSVAKVHTNNSTAGYVQLFAKIAPATGTITIAATETGGAAGGTAAGSVSFSGADQTTGYTHLASAFGLSTAPSVAVTSAVGDMVVDAVAVGSAITSSGQTIRWKNNCSSSNGAGNGAQSTASGAASVTMSYTTLSDFWAIIGVDVLAASGGGGGSPAPPQLQTMGVGD